MKRFLTLMLMALERLIPILGIMRLGPGRLVAVVLATAAHLLPLIGCAFLGWDPIALLLAYWVELALVDLVLVAVLVGVLISGIAGMGNKTPDPMKEALSLFGGWKGWVIFLAVWFVYFAGILGGNLYVICEMAKSHYGLTGAAEALEHLAGLFLPPPGGITAFPGSMSASLALMIFSGLVTLWLQFFRSDWKRGRKVAHIFVAKPLVRAIIMAVVLGITPWGYGPDRLPALATVAAMALAMILLDQRIGLIDHDFGPEGGGDPRFETPYGALVNFGFQIFFLVISSCILISSLFAIELHDRIQKHPVEVSGVIVAARAPEEEKQSAVSGGYWWIIDVEYPAGKNQSMRHILHDIKVCLPSESSPRDGAIRVIHEEGNPRNAFVDSYEDRNRPRNMLIYGIIVSVFGIAAWWAVGRLTGKPPAGRSRGEGNIPDWS